MLGQKPSKSDSGETLANLFTRITTLVWACSMQSGGRNITHIKKQNRDACA